MPLFSTEDVFEYTLVSNAFIRDYMRSAPGDYVKVFLYGLMVQTEKSNADFAQFCGSLNMDVGDVVSAFEYWQQQGLVRIKNGKSIEFQYTRPARPSAEALYTEQEYNNSLQKLFAPRPLTASDFQKIYDYTDTFSLSKEVVRQLMEYCIQLKGKNISFAYIDKVARAWADEGVDATEASGRIGRLEASLSEAGRVLKYLGIKDRLPTDGEIALCGKWTKEWGFSLDAIKTACGKTTASRSPSMKYLDSILKSLYEKGLVTSRKISTEFQTSEADAEKIKQVLRVIGMSELTVSPEHHVYYKKWSETFPFDTILLAARQMVKYSNKSFAYLDKILARWQETGLTNIVDIEKNLQDITMVGHKMEQVFNLAGIRKAVGDADRKRYLKWTREWAFPENVIHLACEISSVSSSPYPYLDKLLSVWHQKGVKTFEQASQEAKKPQQKPSGVKNNAESLKYTQRDNKDKDLSYLYLNSLRDAEEN